ncbi:MAG: tetratricopeptide repeat protein, partial [Gemmatimonadaceae bacterium]
NFLEYATRMQQEGRIDEGMRALAEIADLMPELTEVGRLVEEHAARAGIDLRRRITPARSAAQTAADAPKNLFGMSKDLVFLDIDYDAPRVVASTKTPALAPVVVTKTKTAATLVIIPPPADVEAVKEQPVLTADDAFAQIEASEIPVVDEIDEDSLFADEAELNAIELEIRNSITAETVARHLEIVESDGAIFEGIYNDNSVPTDLEDLMIFDPTADDLADSLKATPPVVDGASILTPFVDPATPLLVLPDFEPTEINSTPSHLLAVASAETIADFLHRDSLHGQARGHSTPVYVSPIATVPHLPAIAEVVNETAEHDDGAGNDDNHDTIVVGLASTGEIVNDAVAPVLLATVAIDVIDGFTSETEQKLLLPADDLTPDDDVVTTSDVASVDDAAVVVGLVLEAAVIDSESDAEPNAERAADRVGDLEVEEFETPNDELSHSRFERVDFTDHGYTDSFSAADELPPLIFPMPATVEAVRVSNTVTPSAADEGDNYDAAFNATFEDAFGDGSEVTFDASLDSSYDATFDDAYDSTFDIETESELDSTPQSNVELPFLVPDELDNIVFIDNLEVEKPVENTLDVADDLDHLFDDGDVPTATVAAEATLAATSRRDDLQDAVGTEPTNWTLRRRLAEALFEAGEREGAIAELNIALSGFEREAQYVQAAEIADELVRVAGEVVSHHQKRLELAIRTGDQNRLRDAYLDLADTLVRRSEDLRAKAVYARVLEIDPWDDRARTALGDAAPPPPARPSEAADSESINLADWLRDDDEPTSTRMRMREPEMSGNEQNDFESLLRHFKEGVARSLGEEDYDSHYDLGVAYKEMGLLDDAIGEFQKALRGRTYRLAAYEALGQCFLEQHSYKVAVTVLSRALHEPAFQEEQRVGVLYLLGYSCEALQRFDEARSYFQRVYATDIHFRDVSQRLADLERITR